MATSMKISLRISVAAALVGAAALCLVASRSGATVISCVGDCDDNGAVTVAELVRAVSIALGTTAVENCEAVDRNDDGRVSVDELVAAVNNALAGCPVEPTRTNTPTEIPPTASPLPTTTALSVAPSMLPGNAALAAISEAHSGGGALAGLALVLVAGAAATVHGRGERHIATRS
jgi:hypothetical protein